MDRSEKYRRASLANFTPEQIATAQANFKRGEKLFPEKQARAKTLIDDKGLGNHREVISHYLRSPMPMSEHQLGNIQMFADSTYEGAFGRGRQYNEPSSAAPAAGASFVGQRAPNDTTGQTPAERIFRQPIRPGDDE